MNKVEKYDIAIVGGGVSGTALFYVISKYTDILKIALFEKYNKVGQVNSRNRNNSQTLHIGDIETNYSLAKARVLKPAAMMIPLYVHGLPEEEQSTIRSGVGIIATNFGLRFGRECIFRQ